MPRTQTAPHSAQPASRRSRTVKKDTPEGFSASELFLNRELSMLAFQRRVLEEAEDESQSRCWSG